MIIYERFNSQKIVNVSKGKDQGPCMTVKIYIHSRGRMRMCIYIYIYPVYVAIVEWPVVYINIHEEHKEYIPLHLYSWKVPIMWSSDHEKIDCIYMYITTMANYKNKQKHHARTNNIISTTLPSVSIKCNAKYYVIIHVIKVGPHIHCMTVLWCTGVRCFIWKSPALTSANPQ